MIREFMYRFGLWLVTKTQPKPCDGQVIDLAAAHRGYVERYAKHAKYGDPDRPIVGVNTGRSHSWAAAYDNMRAANAARRGDAQ